MHTAIVIPFPEPYRGKPRRARVRRAAGQHPFLAQGCPWELTLLPSPDDTPAERPAEPLVFSLSC